MGIQINGQTDTVASTTSGGSVTLTSATLPAVSNISATRVNVSGVSTFTSGPVLIGSGTSTGTSSQPLQVTGGAYVSGSLGIGTTNPSSSLDVNGGIRARGGTPGAVGANNNGYAFNGSGDNDSGMFSSADGQLEFYTDNVEAFRIKDTKIGIGTTSPETKLDVWGQDINEGSAYGQIIIRDTAAYNASPVSGIIFKGEHTPGAAAYFSSIYGGKENATDGNYAGYLALSTRTQGSTAAERVRIDSNGNFSIIQTPGRYTIDTAGGATTIANGGTVDFPTASGMLVVNNWTDGRVTIYLCGGGNTAAIGSVGGQVGSFAYVAGIGGYRWTNNYGSSAVFGFFFVRTRTTA